MRTRSVGITCAGVVALSAATILAADASPQDTTGSVLAAVDASPQDAAVGQLERDQADSQAEAGRYFDEVALELAEPGIWVDPDDPSADDSGWAELDTAAKNAPVPMRIAVVNAAELRATDRTWRPRSELVWEGEEIASQLYDRVGVDGVYAVLTSASSQDEGRGLHAVQHADVGPTYHVGSAVDQAVDCCAPNYTRMIERFIERASDVDHPFYLDAAPWAGGAAGAFGLWWGSTSLSAQRRRRAEERRHLDFVRPMLDEEVIELSTRVSQLPTTADIEQSKLSRSVLDTVEKARHRLDRARGDKDITAVTTLLGDARYTLVCLEARQDGRPIPDRTPPCFLDPRHGPSTDERDWAPETGASRDIPICHDCATRLDNAEVPAARTVERRNYWEAGESVVAYVDGYWGSWRWRFPNADFRRTRESMHRRWSDARPTHQLGRFTRSVGHGLSKAGRTLAESSRSGGGSGGSSFGGGSGSRSSSRSGGSRGF